MEFFGWVGSALFALCGMPQAIKSAQDGHSEGLSWMFLLMWFFGEVFTLVYIIPKMDMPLLANYVVNLGFLGVILYFKIFPRKG